MWTVRLDSLVVSEDLKRLDPSIQRRILAVLESRLALDPKGYGEPLRGRLAGLWKLRIGDYRAIYRIVEQQVEVFVLKIGARRDAEVYLEMFNRLRRIETRP